MEGQLLAGTKKGGHFELYNLRREMKKMSAKQMKVLEGKESMKKEGRKATVGKSKVEQKHRR